MAPVFNFHFYAHPRGRSPQPRRKQPLQQLAAYPSRRKRSRSRRRDSSSSSKPPKEWLGPRQASPEVGRELSYPPARWFGANFQTANASSRVVEEKRPILALEAPPGIFDEVAAPTTSSIPPLNTTPPPPPPPVSSLSCDTPVIVLPPHPPPPPPPPTFPPPPQGFDWWQSYDLHIHIISRPSQGREIKGYASKCPKPGLTTAASVR